MRITTLLFLGLFSTVCTAETIQFQPDALPWTAGPGSLPAGAQMAVLEGNPKTEGWFTMRVRLPAGTRLAPHWHPNPERVTVLQGKVGIGLGDKASDASLKFFAAGSYYVTPARAHHYAWFPENTTLQITTSGPWELHYLTAGDQP